MGERKRVALRLCSSLNPLVEVTIELRQQRRTFRFGLFERFQRKFLSLLHQVGKWPDMISGLHLWYEFEGDVRKNPSATVDKRDARHPL